MQAAHSYLAPDRLAALAGAPLPASAEGTLLSVDIAGFTPLTAAFARIDGARVGADNLALLLNMVYDQLIRCVEQAGGSPVSFSGDAVLCWFAADAGGAALGCAHAMQRALANLPWPDSAAVPAAGLSVKVTLAAGSVRRFTLGDPSIQRIDTLGGGLVQRLASLERLAGSGEILVDARMLPALGAIKVLDQRSDPESGCVAVVVAPATCAADPPIPPPCPALAVDEAALREWVLPVVWNRLAHGFGEFLTEIRPAVALFWSLPDLDLDSPQAEATLDAYVRWAQRVVADHAGVLLQVTLGEKGNYAYAAFGAPTAHEDDPLRAVTTALALRTPPAEPGPRGGWGALWAPLPGQPARIGLAHGIMRTGAYGGQSRRTYGVLGDAVNLAARLMQSAPPGQIRVTAAIQAATGGQFTWRRLADIALKGCAEPLPVWMLEAAVGRADPPATPAMAGVLVGRTALRSSLAGHLRAAQSGAGRIVALTGEAGMGKSRLAAELRQQAGAAGCVPLSGAAQSVLTETPFLVWQPIWRALFGLTAAQEPDQQIERVRAALAAINPALLERLPLLGPALNLEIPATPLTQSLDLQLSNISREALLVECFRSAAQRLARDGRSLVVVMDDLHWADAQSWQLAAAIGRILGPLPVLLLLISRPLDWPGQIAPAQIIELGPLEPAEMSALIGQRLALHGLPTQPAALGRVLGRIGPLAQGNPFYMEELLNYVILRGDDPRSEQAWPSADLPTSLHSLILSRIDQLNDLDQFTLKRASVIGRLFQVDWLLGLSSGDARQVVDRLGRLQAADLVLPEQPEPELAYLFKHVITREVAYESLAASTRATLHAALAAYLEQHRALAGPERWYVLAYHYERSANRPKAIEYLGLAGAAARDTYANEAAVGYYQRLIALLPADQARVAALLDLGGVLGVIGDWPAEADTYRQALALSATLGDLALRADCGQALGAALARTGDLVEAIELLLAAEQFWRQAGLPVKLARVRNQLALVWLESGRIVEAQQLLAVQLASLEAGGDTVLALESLFTAAQVAHGAGDMSLAGARYERCIELASGLDNRPALSNALHSLAVVRWATGLYHQAEGLIERAMAIDARIGDQIALCRGYGNLAAIRAGLEDYAAATSFSAESLALARQLGNALRITYALINLGFLALVDRDLERAHQLYVEALAASRQANHHWASLTVLAGLCHVLFEQAAFPAGWACADEALALAQVACNDHLLIPLLIYILCGAAADPAVGPGHDLVQLLHAVDARIAASAVQLDPYDRAMRAGLVAGLEPAPAGMAGPPEVWSVDALCALAASLNPARRGQPPAVRPVGRAE
jgi:class 3 adenylate cyclase/tetratricopeptide (TPR) repeat protein